MTQLSIVKPSMNQAQDSIFKIKDEGRGEGDCGKEGMGAPVITHGDAAPIFQSTEHNLDFMALFIQGFIVFDRNTAILFAGNAGYHLTRTQSLTQPIGIITSIGQKRPGRG